VSSADPPRSAQMTAFTWFLGSKGRMLSQSCNAVTLVPLFVLSGAQLVGESAMYQA
jgi:hypothetical protein